MEVEFYDYLGQPLIPTKGVILNDDRQEQFNITESSSNHRVGHTGDNDYIGTWHIESNKIIVKGRRTSSSIQITQMDYFELIELQTEEKSYTKFKYIQ